MEILQTYGTQGFYGFFKKMPQNISNKRTNANFESFRHANGNSQAKKEGIKKSNLHRK